MPGVVPPNPEFPVVPMTGTTELRTHGVSGTPVESMLHHPHPLKVAGSGAAGCFRRGDDLPVPFDDVPPGRNLEAYSWGGLTSGSASRAFWLLLAPFTLANVASWVHPVRPTKKFAPIGAMSGLIRLFALSLTVTFMLATATVGVDLIAWQCVADTACGADHFFTEFMTEGFWNRPGARVAAGSLLPVAVLFVFFRLSKSTSEAYEEFGREQALPPDGDASGAADLANPNFWAGGRPFQRLRSMHACTALAVVAGIVGYGARESELIVAAALVLVALCSAVVLSPLAGRRRALLEGQDPPRVVCVAMRTAQWAGLALYGVALVSALLEPAPTEPLPDTAPGLGAFIRWTFAIQVTLLVLYFVSAAWARARSPETERQTLLGRSLFWSFGAPVLAVFALGFAGAYASGLVFRVADYLGSPCEEAGCAPGDMLLAPTYFVAAPAAVAAVAAAIVTGIVTVLWLRRRRRCCVATVAAEYGQPPDSPRVAAIAKAQASASLTDRADALVVVFLLLTLAGMAVSRLLRDVTLIATAGTWLVGVIAIGVVVVGRWAYESDASRRTVGILWDLGTFWPRAAHPFAPPCYCERVVPELTCRIQRLTAHGDVVISAHSQGTIIAAAVVHRLRKAGCARVGLVTYGSPLERLYARLFPHFFGLDELRKVRSNVGGCWRNLYRRTDPIGGPIFTLDVAAWTCGREATPTTDPVDVRLVDPEFERPPGEFVDLPPRAHSDYFHDAMFGVTVAEIASCIKTKI